MFKSNWRGVCTALYPESFFDDFWTHRVFLFRLPGDGEFGICLHLWDKPELLRPLRDSLPVGCKLGGPQSPQWVYHGRGFTAMR
jgi:hypothetical protein